MLGMVANAFNIRPTTIEKLFVQQGQTWSIYPDPGHSELHSETQSQKLQIFDKI